MSEHSSYPQEGLAVVAALGREFDRVIERDGAPRRVPGGVRRLAVACAVALVAFAALTSPGRDAAAWVGGLVGIGEVGGPPTRDDRGFEEKSAPAGPVVIDNGQSPDGARYEWVAYRCKVDLSDEGLPDPVVRGLALALEWPGGRYDGAHCSGPYGKHERVPLFTDFTAAIVPSQRKGVENPDLVVSGTVSSEAARRVKVVLKDARGRTDEVDVNFARVTGAISKNPPRGAPRATFIGFIDGERAARDRLVECLGLRPAGGLSTRALARRCEAARPEIRAYRARVRRCYSATPPTSRRAVRRMERCAAPLPSPITAIAYDEQGRELGRQKYRMSLGIRAPRPVGKPGYRGRGTGKRGRPPVQSGGDGRPVVLVSGRTPDGAPYEYLAQKFKRRGRVYSVCLTRWFPYVRAAPAGGHCGPGFPPTKAYGNTRPGQVKARSFGFLDDGEPATAHLSLQGFARAQVARVRVTHKDGKGGWRDAPVEFVRVRGALRERVGAAEPFGFFVAFLPRSVKRYYRGPDRPVGPRAIEVIAYDDNGKEIGRFKHR